MLRGDFAGAMLEAEGAHLIGCGSDEDEAGLLARCGELGVLTQEAIARMDGGGAGALRGGEELVDGEITLRGRRGAEVDCLTGQFHVARMAVGVGVDGDARDVERTQSAQDAAGDDATVGDEYF